MLFLSTTLLPVAHCRKGALLWAVLARWRRSSLSAHAEQRATDLDPFPFALFRKPHRHRGDGRGFLAGMAPFGTIAFIPLLAATENRRLGDECGAAFSRLST